MYRKSEEKMSILCSTLFDLESIRKLLKISPEKATIYLERIISETDNEIMELQNQREIKPKGRPCWLIGHKEEFNDSGYPVCSCGVHGYYDEDRWGKDGIFLFPSRIWYRLTWRFESWWRKYFSMCCDCKMPDKLFGKWVGNHKNCCPF